MRYRDTEYQVVQTAKPPSWKWTVQLDNAHTKTGQGYNRASAIALAQRAIDKALHRERTSDLEASSLGR
jgi:hypothetical protein